MASLISELLQANEPEFSINVRYLEELSGKPGIDVSLISEIIHHKKAATETLGLDKHDTAIEELYYSLNKKALADSESLAKKLNIKPSDKPEDLIDKCSSFVTKHYSNHKIWVLKPSALKKQLKQNPPKKLMRTFKLRSVDSMIKREPIGQVIIYAKKLETKAWIEKHALISNKISPSDYDQQTIEIKRLSKNRQDQLIDSGVSLKQFVFSDFETSLISVATPKTRFEGDVLFFTNLIVENIKQLRTSSAYLKHQALGGDFEAKLSEARKHGINKPTNNYLSIGWRPFLRNQSLRPQEDLEAFELYLDRSPDLLVVELIDDNLAWQKNYILHSSSGMTVSFNLSDILINAINRHKPEQSYFLYGQRELHDELYARYLAFPRVKRYFEQGTEL